MHVHPSTYMCICICRGQRSTSDCFLAFLFMSSACVDFRTLGRVCRSDFSQGKVHARGVPEQWAWPTFLETLKAGAAAWTPGLPAELGSVSAWGTPAFRDSVGFLPSTRPGRLESSSALFVSKPGFCQHDEPASIQQNVSRFSLRCGSAAKWLRAVLDGKLTGPESRGDVPKRAVFLFDNCCSEVKEAALIFGSRDLEGEKASEN